MARQVAPKVGLCAPSSNTLAEDGRRVSVLTSAGVCVAPQRDLPLLTAELQASRLTGQARLQGLQVHTEVEPRGTVLVKYVAGA